MSSEEDNEGRALALYGSSAQETRTVHQNVVLLPDNVFPTTVVAFDADTKNGLPRPLLSRFSVADASCMKPVLRVSTDRFPFSVTYFYSGLSWKPSYALFVDEERLQNLVMQATVHNATNGDVANADVELVVGDVEQPRAQLSPDESMPRMMLAQSVRPSGVRAVPTYDDLVTANEEAEEPEGGRNEYERVPIGRASFPRGRTMLTALQVDRFRSRPHGSASASDLGDTQRVFVCDLRQHDGGVRVAYRFVADHFLPRGPVSVYDRHAHFVGASTMPRTPPGEEAELLLGRPNRFACISEVQSSLVEEREEAEESDRPLVVVAATHAVVRTIETVDVATRIVNRTDRPARVALRYPVGSDPVVATPPAERRAGHLEWLYVVPPGESRLQTRLVVTSARRVPLVLQGREVA